LKSEPVDVIVAKLPVAGSSTRLQIVLEKRNPLEIRLQDWVEFSLRVGMPISESLLGQLERLSRESEAEEVALRFLRFRARTEHEVIEHLRRKEYEEDIVASVTTRLKDLQLLDDEAFAEAFAEQQGSTRSRMEVSWKLRQRGIDSTVIDAVLNRVLSSDAEVETAMRLAQKQLKKLGHADENTCRVKVATYLQRKGFSMETVYLVLENLRAQFPPNVDS